MIHIINKTPFGRLPFAGVVEVQAKISSRTATRTRVNQRLIDTAKHRTGTITGAKMTPVIDVLTSHPSHTKSATSVKLDHINAPAYHARTKTGSAIDPVVDIEANYHSGILTNTDYDPEVEVIGHFTSGNKTGGGMNFFVEAKGGFTSGTLNGSRYQGSSKKYTQNPQEIVKPETVFIYDRNEQLQLVLSQDSIPYRKGTASEELNGAVKINLEILSADPRLEYIENEGRIVAPDSKGTKREFVIRQIKDKNDKDGPVKKITGEGGEYDLIDDFLSGYQQASVDIQTALEAVTNGTRWEIGHVDRFRGKEQRSVELNKVTVRKAVIDIVNAFDGEVDYRVETKGNRITRRFIDVYEKRGSERMSHRFEAGKDIKSTGRELDSAGIKTALYGYGKADANGNRLTFAEIEWSKANGDPTDKPKGQVYVGDPKAKKVWGRMAGRQHKFGFYDGQEEDPATLLLNAWRDLQKKNGLNKTYEINVVSLGDMLGVSYEDVMLGDTVGVYDPEITPAVTSAASIIKYNHNLSDKRKSTVELGHFRNEMDLAGRVSDVEKDYNDKKGEFEKKPEQVRDDMNKNFKDQHDYIDSEMDKVDKSIKQAKSDADDAFKRANKAVSDAQDGFDKAQNALKKANKNEGNYSAIQKKVDSIATRVSDNEGSYSALSQTVDGIQTDVKNNAGDISTVTQTAETLVSRVGHKGDSKYGDSVFSQISQLDDDINLRVKKDDLISQINLSPGHVLIDGDHIDLSGKVLGDSDAVFKGDVIGANIYSDEVTFVGDELQVANTIRLGDSSLSTTNRHLYFDDGAYFTAKDHIIEVWTDEFKYTSGDNNNVGFRRVSTDDYTNDTYPALEFTGSNNYDSAIFQDRNDGDRLKLESGNLGVWLDRSGSVYFTVNGERVHAFYSNGSTFHKNH